jgi:dTDP-4-amino-4,6-dideoxygalactose transaminase
MYEDGLNEIAEIVLPRSPNEDPDKFEVYQNYEIEVDASERKQLMDYLKENHIGTILQWGGKAVHQFEGLGLKFSLPFTERLMSRMLLLPMNTGLSNDQVDHVITKIRSFYGK